MIFTEVEVAGALIIEPEMIRDDRGAFARLYDEDEFQRRGLPVHYPQWSVSRSTRAGTLRGMHYQAAPYAESKLVRCTVGTVFDVIIDLRADSSTYLQWTAVELSADNGRTLYVPPGVAHGLQTLTDGCEVTYHISEFYHAELQRGVPWNDPHFDIPWPPATRIISERDLAFLPFDP